MRIVGLITVIVIAVAAVGGIVVLIASIPDIRRYLKIREM